MKISSYKKYGAALLLVCSCLLLACKNDRSNTEQWETISSQFINDYKKLNIPLLQLSFVANMEQIKSIDSVLQQERVFKDLAINLKKIEKNKLSESELLDYELLHYECELNLERITLEKKWLATAKGSIANNRIFDLKNGKQWYAYFIKKWVDKETNPDELYQLGIREIKKVKAKIKAIQLNSGMDSLSFNNHSNGPSFYYTSVTEVQHAFEETQKDVAEKLADLFPFLDSIPELKIAQGTNKKLAKVPGFYKENTVYYNFFGTSYSKRQVGWLYMHEGMPGHHYQQTIQNFVKRSEIQQAFNYRGVSEGWAAYIEELGEELGAYQNSYDELGKWEWDIIRSVRVALDVALNHYGWSDEKALAFWQQHIKGKDDIAIREINRMKRWPAQVITYKYGSDKIIQWKAACSKKSDFNPKEFHKNILKNGSLPYAVLKRQVGL